MKKHLLLFVATLGLLTSCEEDLVVYDVNNGEAVASIVNGSSQTLPVPDTGDTAIVEVGVTTVSDVDRTITLTVDASSTADPSEYDIQQSTLVIPAGSFVGQVEVAANFDAIPETGQTSLVLNLEDVQGADTIASADTHTINFFRFCPFEGGADFLGEYTLETVTTGIFGVSTLTEGTVEITQGATVADRQFSVKAYPAFGDFSPFDFQFSLICGEIVVQATDINVGCGGANGIGPSSAVVSTYNAADDSEIVINFVDDTRGQCEGQSYEVAIRLTKN